MSTGGTRSDDGKDTFYCMKKVTYWDIYGVKSFPYKGKRKHTPLLHQHFNGQFMIQNDLLGLTIHQFESRFEECLERRTRNKEWLLNIRFPDKTSDGYIEYLENCQEGIQYKHLFTLQQCLLSRQTH